MKEMVRMDKRIAWRALTSGSATLRLINMDENKLRKHIVRMMIIGFLLLLLPMTGIAAEQSKLPEWILDTIFLPVPLNNTKVLYVDLFKDKKSKIIMYYHIGGSGRPILIDLTTHQEIDPSTLELFTEPKTNSHDKITNGLEKIKCHIFNLTLPGNAYNISGGDLAPGAHCGSPLVGYLIFYKLGRESDRYLFLLSSFINKFEFHTNGFCFGMNGKETIEVHNRGIVPLFWRIDNDRIVLGDHMYLPFLIVIDANKIDLALKETKTMIFDHAGVKGYWVRKSLIDECIKKAERELTGKGYDIHSKKPLKGNMSVNEYIDQAITNELNKSN